LGLTSLSPLVYYFTFMQATLIRIRLACKPVIVSHGTRR
jgi:hypothetical protein